MFTKRPTFTDVPLDKVFVEMYSTA